MKRPALLLLSALLALTIIPIAPREARAELGTSTITGYARATVTVSGNLQVSQGGSVNYYDNAPANSFTWDIVASVSADIYKQTPVVNVSPGIYSDPACTTLVSSATGVNQSTIQDNTAVTTYTGDCQTYTSPASVAPAGSGYLHALSVFSGPGYFGNYWDPGSPHPLPNFQPVTMYAEVSNASAKAQTNVTVSSVPGQI